jgi:hypothetical protein
MEPLVFNQQDAFFPVIQRPIHIFNHHETHSGFDAIPNRMAIVNENTNVVLGIVSKNYTPVLNKDVYDLFINALSPYKVKEPIHHLDVDGRKWSCDFILDDPATNYDITGTGDIVGVALRAFNAYDGKKTFGYEIFGFRSMCSNGMIFGKQSLFIQAFRHFVGKSQKLLERFKVQFGLFQDNAKIWSQWNKIDFTRENLDTFLLGKKYVGERLSKEIVDLFDNKYAKDGQCRVWDMYNLLTYMSTHESRLKKNVSHIYGNKYRSLVHLIEDFYKTNKVVGQN